jgi:hypothetical protein
MELSKNIIEQYSRRRDLEHELKSALARDESPAVASRDKVRRKNVLRQQASKSIRSSRDQEQPVRSGAEAMTPSEDLKQSRTDTAQSNAEAMAVFEFLNESHSDTPDALEMVRRASAKP